MDRDRWAEWLAVRRFGGDAETRERVLAELSAIRDTLLDRARLGLGETLLDVGCGEGLIAFAALERGAGEVVFSDVSTDLLGVCEEAARDLGVVDRCRFLEASADDLHAISDESIDVVTTRSVLIYVSRKRDAFCEFARVLRPDGRISLYEPINRFGRRYANTWMGYDLSPLDGIGAKLRAVYDALQPSDTDPMLDFDERDLIRLAQDAGFFPIQLRLEADIKPTEPRAWDAFLHGAGNPNIPTLAEAMQQSLTPAERRLLSAHLQPQVEQGLGEWRIAVAYLVATKASTAG
jgi:SAM-dependent methyltransferase